MASLSLGSSLVLVHAPLVSQDLGFEFQRMGWDVLHVRPEDLGLESISTLVRDHRPSAFVGINHSPELAWAVTRAGIPYISWTVDPLPLERMRVLEGTVCDLVSVFLHRSTQVATFRSLGFAKVEWLPLAAPEHRFEELGPHLEDPLPPCFVGSSLLDEIALYRDSTARWGWSAELSLAVEAALEPLVDLALANVDFAGFRPDGADLPANLRALAQEPPAQVAEALNAWLSVRTRRRRVGGIALESLVVFGDGGWTDIVGDRWKGPLANGRDMTRIYAGSLANIDVPRIHQRDIATLRAFDVAAAGGCLVAEPSADLCRMFQEGREFLAYRDGRELSDVLEHLRRHPDEAKAVGSAARLRAKAQHRLEQRACRLVGMPGMDPKIVGRGS